MPAALHEYDGGVLVRLLQGLSGYDESLYREWLLNHPMRSETADEGESRRMLSYHRYSQDTSLLLGIFNHVGALTCGLMETKNGSTQSSLRFFPRTRNSRKNRSRRASIR